MQRERARNRVWNPMRHEEPQNVPIETLLIRVELRFRRRTHGQSRFL
jgi:hypothetical protein